MFGNLLNIAASVIPQQTLELFKYDSRTADRQGRQFTAYAAPVNVTGSWQPVSAQDAKELGLDIERRYSALYSSHPFRSVERGSSPDVVRLADGTIWEVIGEPGDWFQQDGWKGILLSQAKGQAPLVPMGDGRWTFED